MKEKSRKVFEEYQTPFEQMLDAVIDARGNNHTVIPEPEITFTPGVPTEDGWYVCKCDYRYTIWQLVLVSDGKTSLDGLASILSHAKLPEL